jgi:hypothetical protein
MKDSPSPPPAPDPWATAQAQKDVNTSAATTQANLNRINQITPQGSLTYSTTGTNADGTPQYTQTQTLSPDEQAKYDQANKVSLALGGLANQNIARVGEAQSKPFTYDGMTPVTSSVASGPMQNIASAGPVQGSLDYSKLSALPGANDFSADAKRASDNIYSQAASRLDPQWANNDNDFKAQMAAQGISENSDAYRRAYTNENQAKTDAYNQANYSAVAAGDARQQALYQEALASRQQGQNEADTQGGFANSAQGQIFGQNSAQAQMANTNQNQRFNQDAANATLGNSARQQQIEQSAYLRNMPLNDIATLLGTGPGVAEPNFSGVPQVGVAAPDYQGIVANNYNAATNQYNQQQAARSQMLGSIFGAAGTAATMFSDMRLKENIRRIGALANGLATYAFNYIGGKAQQFGVMAQEVLFVKPEAVSIGDDGYMRVDYRKVY